MIIYKNNIHDEEDLIRLFREEDETANTGAGDD
jgi:hypothetical protein